MRKKVLIITYYWPPSGGPGVQRCLKFVKYLRSFGIEPVVLTVDASKASYPVIDESLKNEIPEGIEVIRTNSFEPLKLFSTLFGKEKLPYASIPDREKMSFVGKLSLYIRANFFIPDARVGWNKFAIEAAEKIIKRTKIDAILTSSPPHSTQLIGLHLKQKFGLRWVADLRDPWTDIYYYNQLHHSNRSKRNDLAYEQSVLNTADGVIATSESTALKFASKLAKQKDKVSVITNGYDPQDFENIPVVNHEKFTITFVGTIGMQFGLKGLVNALVELSQNHSDLLFQIQFIGKMDSETKDFISKQLGTNTELIGYVPHKNSIAYTCSANLLLLVIPKGENQGTVPGKTFEYLATKRPILCLAPEGSSAGKIIEECEGGIVLDHDDVDSIRKYILGMIQRHRRGEDTSIKNNNFTKYSREKLTQRLAELILKQ